jgi:hypothetical protein
MEMKAYPQNWTTRQLAFFAGIISAGIRMGDLKRIVDECVHESNGELYFQLLIERVEPLIGRDQWEGCVENCQKLFRTTPIPSATPEERVSRAVKKGK